MTHGLPTGTLSKILSAAVSGVTGLARLQPWYQPNVNTVDYLNYEATAVAPHAETVRDSVTIAAGKIGILNAAQILIMRDGAPTTAGDAYAYCAYNDGGYVSILYVEEINMTVGTPKSQNIGYGTVLLPGKTIRVSTRDTSTGGTYTYKIGVRILEFAA